MVLPRLKRAIEPPSLKDWNTARANSVRSGKGSANRDQGPQERLQSHHWLALTCYLEELDPVTLSLAPELLSRIQEELSELGKLDPLRTYAAVVRRLTADTPPADGKELRDAVPE